MSFKKGILALFFIAVSIGAYKVTSLAHFAMTSNSPSETQSKEVIIIQKGTIPMTIAKRLEARSIISSAQQLRRLGVILRKWPSMKAGEYEISSSMTPLEIFDVITSGVSVAYKTTIREGINMFQVGEILEKKGFATQKEFVALCRSQSFIRELGFTEKLPSLDGYLYPETYLLDRSISTKDIIKKMVQNHNAVWDADKAARAKALGFTKHQVITLASMIEKETGAGFERPTISSVFHNRLKKRMRLQSDPTTIYGVWETFNGNLRRRHLKEKNNYNTYAIRGLPVGPIASPGKEAIVAALYPNAKKYLYFVSKNDGTHYFSKTFKEHNQAVTKYQKNRSARKGKSWRDLPKKKRANQKKI